MNAKMIFLSALLLAGFADGKVRFSFQEEEIPKVIETYSRYTGEKFLMNGSIRGRMTVTSADDLSNEDAYNMLSSGLALNGYAISKQGDVHVVVPVNELQRSLIETTTARPTLKPERMVTLMYTVKAGSPQKVLKDIQGLVSKDGDVAVSSANDKMLLITDWSSNLQRVYSVLETTNPPAQKKQKAVAKKEFEEEKKPMTAKSTEELPPLAEGEKPVEMAKPPTGTDSHPYQTKPMKAQNTEGGALPWMTENSSTK